MGIGMSQGDVMRLQLLQAKGELKTLKSRVLTTQKSIEILEVAAKSETSVVAAIMAMIDAQLIQLRANLNEGLDRVEYLEKSISAAESPVKRAIIVPPGKA